MSFGGHNPNVSLLPDNPSAQIVPVQGGGGSNTAGWYSAPISIPVSPSTVPLNVSHVLLNRYKGVWKRTLGPNIPSRRKPHSDPHIIVGVLNITECPIYIVAPLRGDMNAANDCIEWANEILETKPEVHVAFMGPIKQGNKCANGALIEKQIEALSAKYPGHAFCVDNDDSTIQGLDGLLLHALPNTSKQVGLGFLPDPEAVYHRSSRRLDCLDVDTLRIPAGSHRRADQNESINTITFKKSSTVYNHEKELKTQTIVHDHDWSAPPGWVTEIRFGAKTGGAPKDAVAPAMAPPVDPPVVTAKTKKRNPTISTITGISSISTLTGISSISTLTGISSISTLTGISSISTLTGISSISSITGISSISSITGVSSISSIIGISSISSIIGISSISSITSISSISSITGISSISSITGISSISTLTGVSSISSITTQNKDYEEITLGPRTYKIRKPTDAVMQIWEKGEFTGDESALLMDQQLKYDNKVFPLFFKGLVSHTCDSEANTQMSPECGIFRYIMADRYYQKVKEKNNGPQPMTRKL